MSGERTHRPDGAEEGVEGREGPVKLPMAGGGGDGGGSGDGPGDGAGGGGAGSGPGPDGDDVPEPEEVSSLRLVGTLTLAGALAGLAIVLVHQWAQPRIEAHRARVLRSAIEEVLGGPDHWETMYVVDGSATAEPGPGVDTANVPRIYRGFDAAGTPVGVAVPGEKPGFQDIIRVLFGYDPATDRVLGMKVLESKETPGLGDKIMKDSAFIREFEGVEAPIEGVKARSGTGAPDEVDMITGATISSETVIEIINMRLAELEPVLDGLRRGAAADGSGAGGGAGTAAGNEDR